MTPDKFFVFVVCGEDKHIDTLNFSLPYLRRFSKNGIIVVTDFSRNTKDIQHDHILNVKTPEHLDHHQASIFLKTGLHKFLDMRYRYCYLDTDVIAVSTEVDSIFEQNYGPVTFAPDHCNIKNFSPSAIFCGCLENKKNKSEILNRLQEKYNPNLKITDPIIKEKLNLLVKALLESKKNPLQYMCKVIRFFMSKRIFHFNKEFYYDKKLKIWHSKDGSIVAYDVRGFYKKIEKESFFKWHKKQKYWLDDLHENAYIASCDHLVDTIKIKFNIDITDYNWQHWNGGVFLFDKDSIDFLENWHNMTMVIFADSKWRTRDQGTLIATVWKMGLQKQKTLSEKYNFLADYYNKNIIFDIERGFSKDNMKTFMKPYFLHVYHEFGRKGWPVWDYIESLSEN
ncbi:MAG: hypothetical protein PHT69_12870 [Bacteroidales bacterium]|nr:hypothetical protein [Bacteroidales bacterium]